MGKERDPAIVYETHLQNFCEKTSEIISGSVSPERIRGLIDLANSRKVIVHGIKIYQRIKSVEEQGVLPLTPEGGYVSFWATGYRIFGSSLDNLSPLNTYDTPFFNYAHTRNLYGEPCMALAVTSQEKLKGVAGGVKIKPDSQLTLGFTVPRSALHLLVAEAGSDEGSVADSMFGMLEDVVTNSFSS